MKKNGFLRYGACLSLMAMLPTMFGPTLMMQRVEAQSMNSSGQSTALVDPSSQIESKMDLFWNDVWQHQFVDGQVAMVMSEETSHNDWTVQMIDDTAGGTVIEGSLTIIARIELPQLSAPKQEILDAGLNRMEHYAVAGLISGPGGSRSIVLKVTEVEFPADPAARIQTPTIIRVLQPIDFPTDLASSIDVLMDFDLFVSSMSNPHLMGYWRCVGQVLACQALTLGCLAAAPACAGACAATCAGTLGLGCVACVLACVGGGVALCQSAYDCWKQAIKNGCVPTL